MHNGGRDSTTQHQWANPEEGGSGLSAVKMNYAKPSISG